MFRRAAPLAVNAEQRQELEALVRNGNSSQRVALRCRLLLLAHEGIANHAIAQQLNVSRLTILALRAAFASDGMAAVRGIRKRKARAKVLTPDLEQKILDATLKTRPGDGSTHWSVRMLAQHLGVSRTIVHRVWQRHDVQPHRVEHFKLSKDPQFEEKVREYHRPVLESSRSRPGTVRGREEPDSGVGSHRADSSFAARLARTSDP